MSGAVLLARSGLRAWAPLPPALCLVVEVLSGGVAYVAAVLLLARRSSRELLDKVRVALRPRAAG
jgi:hypothetical protein